MKAEISVQEVREIFNGIPQPPQKLYGMIRPI
jgi:hypothetical protein